MLELLSLAPIQRGIIALIIAGLVLPLCGMPLIELNLLPMRFMLMHGALFGGSLAVVLNQSPLLFMVGINIIFVIIISYVNINKFMDLGRLSSFFMVASLGGAAIVTQVKSVPGQTILSLLWGSPYALSRSDLIVFIIWALIIIFMFVAFRNQFIAYLFDPIMARSLGVNTKLFSYMINLFIGISVALAMKLLGALLVDVLLILPVVLSSFWKRGQKFYTLLSISFGLFLSLSGTVSSLVFDLPASGLMAVLGSFIFLILLILKEE
ncbi:metal ABC transporter permease [Thiospirochaeta perfilievii]|uniref:Metal ABC transporter permease n=1 Tax=Thiospirochaeta perfilievii TaxID=252967 RepID=A0A5C1Q6M4_9SPIO|nr:metal ABC transporter permease [Thiospirochaeta perfilievii]QEN03713.1 metal ABC transporter permease [Thiospirochaeta perfilievii]